MEVVLRWTTSESRSWLEPVDDVADNNLGDVENEYCESKTLTHGLATHRRRVHHSFGTYRVRTIKVRTIIAGDDCNPKSPANDDDWTGKEGLYDLMSLEPGTGRGPEVTRD